MPTFFVLRQYFQYFCIENVYETVAKMILERLSILNYKNIAEATLEFSPNINCLIGHNGVGKTNVLDAIYYLSFCRSLQNPIDSQVMRHDADFLMLEGAYFSEKLKVKSEEFATATESNAEGTAAANSTLNAQHSTLNIYAGMKRGQKKHFKRNKKEYRRLSEHIGLIPLVMVSPGDTYLIEGNSEERRKLMDMVISQYDPLYMEELMRYNKALLQRNTLLKMEDREPDPEVMDILEEQMANEGEVIFRKRSAFVESLLPVFQHYYQVISQEREQVGLSYVSHCQRGPLLEVIRRDRLKDRAVGYSLHGIHRDDLEFTMAGHPMKREGSQGQNKTYVIALKLAQFNLLKRTASQTTPLLLLDDIFDKLDADRVEQIVKLVSGDDFGQIFITDTNREHLDRILSTSNMDYKVFHVEGGCVSV